MTKKETIPAAGANYKETTAVDHIARHPELSHGTERNLGLTHDGFFTDDEVPEYTERFNPGGHTKIKVEVPASKRNGTESKPSAARPVSQPDWGAARGLAGPIHPKSKPETARPGAAPRHNASKPVTSTPDGGPRQSKSGGKPKNSADTNDSIGRPKTYGNRAPVPDGPTVRRRSELVSSGPMLADDNNPKAREGNYYGVSRTSLKDAKKLKK